MLRFSCLLLLFSIATSLVKAQSPTQRAEVMQPIQQLFDGMLASDTTGLANCFHPTARLMSVSTAADGSSELRETKIDQFTTSIAGAPKGVLKEVLHYAELRVDGDFATAWTPYTFYYQGNISHCGVNAFQLAKTGADNTWQIIRITDTRRRGDCSEENKTEPVAAIDSFASQWHRAAAEADGDVFFDSMDSLAIYIGTDKTEHWTKAAFLSFAKPYFDKGKAWAFKATERHVFHYPDENIAYWDEVLDTWMGPCRGTGIVKRQVDGSWKLLHYTLSVTIDNDLIKEFIKLTKTEE